MRFHSCGKIDRLVGCIVSAGWDSWDGMLINDFPSDYAEYGDRLMISLAPVRIPAGSDPEVSRLAAEDLLGPYLETAADKEKLPLLFYLFTDIKTKTSDVLIFGTDGEEIVERAFGVAAEAGKAVLPGVVSRKKQVVPPLMATIQGLIKEREE